MRELYETDIKYIGGIGPKKAEILKTEIDVFTANDLLAYYPYKHIDRSKIYQINEITSNMPYIQIRGRIIGFETYGERRNKRLVAKCTDGTGFIDLVWFQGEKYITDKYKRDLPYLIFGKPTIFNNSFNIVHPEIDPYIDGQEKNLGLMPFYNTTEKMKRHYLNSRAIQKIMISTFNSFKNYITETLSDEILQKQKLISKRTAIQNIHFPQSIHDLQKAEFRLKFEELFYIQLNILRYTKQRKQKLQGVIFNKIGDYFNDFYKNNLPFELTNAQKRIIKEVRQEMTTGYQMNRLLQGDVGSGKTLVALMLMLIALDNKSQTCIMAPTEILAHQHFDTIKQFIGNLPIKIQLLTGSTKKKDREIINKELTTGELQILIGTHALIEDSVQFANLGLVVIDEQHRFGVAQRAKLWNKNKKNPPHILVMTATPIPRTLAMTIYGDLDISIIDELPPGRKPIQTMHAYDKKKSQLYESVRKQLKEERQVYIVYPLIEESEKIDLQNLETGYKSICEIFSEYQVCKVHGKMTSKDKNIEMQKFINKEAQIMVATTVIEVGVNVPNASVMIIESAQRFGLSQLHQLRGRVGRGANQSYCILVTPYELSSDTRKRMDIMVESNDGFEIAEADLKLRGPGDLEGTQQSGIPFNLKIANLAKDYQILEIARDCAENVLANDPELSHTQNQILKSQLSLLKGNRYNWGLIS